MCSNQSALTKAYASREQSDIFNVKLFTEHDGIGSIFVMDIVSVMDWVFVAYYHGICASVAKINGVIMKCRLMSLSHLAAPE